MDIFFVNVSLSSSSSGIGGGRAGKWGDIEVNAGIAVSGGIGDRGSSTSSFMSINRCMNHFCNTRQFYARLRDKMDRPG